MNGNILNFNELQVTQFSWYGHETLPTKKIDNARDFDEVFLVASYVLKFFFLFCRSTQNKIVLKFFFIIKPKLKLLWGMAKQWKQLDWKQFAWPKFNFNSTQWKMFSDNIWSINLEDLISFAELRQSHAWNQTI